MPKPKPPVPGPPSSQEELESSVPDEDAVATHTKDLRVIQSALAEADRRLEISVIRAATLTAPSPPYVGAQALERSRQALLQCRKELAEAFNGLEAAEEQWQQHRE